MIVATIIISYQTGPDTWALMSKSKVFYVADPIGDIMKWALEFDRHATFSQLKFSDLS